MDYEPVESAPWLAAVDIDDPAGPDLTYSDERTRIESAVEQAASGLVDDSEWNDVADLVDAQLLLTKDIWLPVYLIRIGAWSNDLARIERGTAVLAGLFEKFWNEAHPKLEEYGVEGRKAPCESLVRIGEFLGPLRRMILIAHPRLGQFSGADFERFAQEGAGADGYGPFRTAIAETPEETLDALLAQLGRIASHLRQADNILSAEAASADQTGTNFEATYDAIEKITEAIGSFVSRPSQSGGEALAGQDAEMGDGEAGHGSPPSTRVKALGALETRDDVSRALDRIIDYYHRREPSSPIPVALRRVKGWITMDFMAILSDVSPTGLPDAERVLRGTVEESGSSDIM